MTITLDEFRKAYRYNEATQILQQYLDIKFEYQDCLIMFRLGDFYELFYDDAVIISKFLGLTLTKRANKDTNVPMCGVPFHAINTYLPRLIEEGYKIAICEQLESPEEAKKRGGHKAVVNRDVVRVITQGTLFEENLLQNNPNYLMSLVCKDKTAALCYIDISTSEFNLLKIDSSSILSEITRINPKEILVAHNLPQEIKYLISSYQNRLVFQVDSYFAENKCKRSIQDYYNISNISSLGEISELEVKSLGSVLQYLQLTQKNNLPKLAFPKILNSANLMMIDAATRRGLEIVCNNVGSVKGSLFDAINKTNTKSGSRLLYKMLTSPLTDIAEIQFRHNLIDLFKNYSDLNLAIRSLLKKLGDTERVLSRIGMKRSNPKDLVDLKEAIEVTAKIKQLITNEIGFIYPDELEKLARNFISHDELCEIIEQTIATDSFGNVGEIGYIKSSYHPRIQELSALIEDSNSITNHLRAKYAKETGIDTLKICHNNILGMFIEVTAKQASKVDNQIFIHRQTTLNNIRFTTPELQKLESEIVNAKSALIALEKEIFISICAKVLEELQSLSQMIEGLSMLDVITSLAYLAKEKNYIKPDMTLDSSFIIEDGRHPVVENSLKALHESFVANNCDLSSGQNWIITGPNMSGKSTFLRQNAIISILAQAGCFVPASYAKIGIIDKLFSRIGASDDLSKGQSTFMVEMTETSAILAQATSKSLIILDEVGRGTSTYDGVSIAWSALEYIHETIRCRTLFATHYHELAQLEDRLANIKNYHISTKEVGNKLLFLHKINPGAADKSYGINVAQLAGLPDAVINRAKQILCELETDKKEAKISSLPSESQLEQGAQNEKYQKLKDFIESLDADQMTPRQALEQIYKIKNLCNLG
jgi:DNA mismatch repair protein MutS